MRGRLTRTGSGGGWALLAAFLCAACGTSPTTDAQGRTTEIPAGAEPVAAEQVDTIHRSFYGGLGPTRAVVSDREAWEASWAQIHATVSPVPPAPEVDFATRRLLLLATGARPSGGYTIDVSGLATAEGTMYVSVRTTSPGPTCLVTMAVTHPTLVLSVPDGPEEVVFVEEEAISSCT